ncbi:hypothetical protein [Streptomyces sp. NPDC057740]|uniref:hypothetical protein n=1 Tax=Streptomyces sp. NPDC057740 TaxID=3346234 RepID=UPI0036B66E47
MPGVVGRVRVLPTGCRVLSAWRGWRSRRSGCARWASDAAEIPDMDSDANTAHALLELVAEKSG